MKQLVEEENQRDTRRQEALLREFLEILREINERLDNFQAREGANPVSEFAVKET